MSQLPDDGTSNDGTPDDGTSNDGTPDDGTPDDGTVELTETQLSEVAGGSIPMILPAVQKVRDPGTAPRPTPKP
jgi:hypothetical protein